MDDATRESLRRGAEKAAETAGPDYGQALKELSRAVGRVSQVDLICCLPFYFLTSAPGENPEFNRPEGIFQHHVELIYAVALRTAPEAARPEVALKDGLPAILEAAKRAINAFMLLAATKPSDKADPEATQRELVLYHLRLHGALVRGVSYAEDQRRLMGELFAPLDDQIQNALGFGCVALVEWWWAVTDLVEARMSEHFERIQELAELPLDEDWPAGVEAIFRRLPVQPDRKLAARFEENQSERLAFAFLVGDLNLYEVFGFTADELIECYPGEITKQAMHTVLDGWSLRLGDLSGVALNRLVASNPVQREPIVCLDNDLYLWPLSQALLQSGIPMLESLLGVHELLRALYFNRRAEYLEDAVAEAFRERFPTAKIYPSLHWLDPSDGKKYETDLLVLVGAHALIVECKGGRMSRQAMEGKSRDLRDAIDELIVAPAEQSQRFAKFLESHPGVHEMWDQDDQSVIVDASDVREAVTLATTLEPLAAVLPTMRDLNDAGLTGQQLEAITYSLSLYDLWTVLEMLEHPAEVLHYFKRRGELENRRFLHGEENDLLGFYLKSGFNLGEAEFEPGADTQVFGLSDEIDVYRYSREAGVSATKPRVSRTKYWEELLTKVEERKNPRWTEIGVTLCNVSPEDQEAFERSMAALQQRWVRGKEPEFFLFINGPEQRRDYFVGFLAKGESDGRKAQVDGYAAQCFSEHPEAERLILVGWPPDARGTPYSVLAVVNQASGHQSRTNERLGEGG